MISVGSREGIFGRGISLDSILRALCRLHSLNGRVLRSIDQESAREREKSKRALVGFVSYERPNPKKPEGARERGRRLGLLFGVGPMPIGPALDFMGLKTVRCAVRAV